jgi:hypothetical protein
MKRDILRYGKLDTIPLARGYRMDERDPNAEYSQKDIEKMREELAESEWESLRNEDIQSILWDGCPGWATLSNDEIISRWKDIFEYPS